jgi:uncharacterized protein
VEETRTTTAPHPLAFQRCASCGHAWLPPREACPQCLSPEWTWEDASGRARLISWAIYHRAFADTFADRLPYTVLLVELDEGPRLVAEPADEPVPQGLAIEQVLELGVDRGLVWARPIPQQTESTALKEEK